MPQSGRDPVVHKNHIEVRGHHLEFTAFPASGSRNPYLYIEERERHDVLKSFKGASLYKAERDAVHKSERSAEGGPLARCIAMRYRARGPL
jgi:hypothetical protein